MGKKYPGMSIEDHREAAKLLLESKQSLHKLLFFLQGKYSLKVQDKIVNVENKVDQIRNMLDDFLYSEQPGMKDLSEIYYQKSEV